MADLDTPAPTDTATGAREPYRVLARKYRPTGFDGLIGQEALVRTLSNAIASGRLAHAFVLTGVRGIGKTTTARIIARALNCVGPDGTGGPTTEPCGVCPHCKAIAEDRHVDVLEMDAASRTGVDDIRELIEGVRYRPTSARFKIYIIDEVHMLSRNAFNALLKTLEEPPEHVKFVFATTEIRKVPVTVLSRCQRFDLRRIDTETLAAHFKAICGKEGVTASDGALAMIARAADGSVRDGLSLLDQAIAHGGAETGVSEDQVRGMLGLADRTRVFDLLAAVLGGDAKGALDQLAEQYAAGADPAVVLEDLLELTHWLTRVKVTPDAAAAPGIPEAEKVRGTDMAGRLAMPVLTRAWQMLLKGLGECRVAPSPLQAAEMLLIRLAYAADLPTPEEALKSLRGEGPAPSPAPAASATPAAPAPRASAPSPRPTSAPPPPQAGDPGPTASAAAGPALSVVPETPEPEIMEPELVEDGEPAPLAMPDPRDFRAVVALTRDLREPILHANLVSNLHLVRFEPGRIEFRPGDKAPAELAHDLSRFLNAHTDRRWVVLVSDQAGDPTLQQQVEALEADRKAKAAEEPLVRAILETFPGATVDKVRSRDTDV